MYRYIPIFLLLMHIPFAILAQNRSTDPRTEPPLTRIPPQQQTVIKGIVKQNGVAVTGAKVAVVSSTPERSFETATNENGEFEISKVPFGEYQVRVEQPGFPVKQQKMTVGPLKSSYITIDLDEGPINPFVRTSRKYEVFEKTFTDENNLRQWLNTPEGKRVIRFVFKGYGKSLVVLEHTPSNRAFYVASMNNSPTAQSLQSILDQNPAKEIVGVHELSTNLSLVVLRDGN